MALHRGQRGGHFEAGPPVMRFEYQDRMAEQEADRVAAVAQRVEAEIEGLPAVLPNETVEIGGKRVSVWSGEREVELRRRDAVVAKLRGEGRR